ncbi:MAG: SGNH/GDSL hydrolase family protein, partial [Myxococcota bacterium]
MLLKRITALLLGTLLTVVLAEFLLSRSSLIESPPGQHRRSETRAFEQTPGFEGHDKLGNAIMINSQGLRADEVPLAKPEGVFRILVLGDSVTFGENVTAAQSFSKQTEAILNQARPGKRVEVLNAGVRGYNTYQELILLKEVGLAYHPDLVVVCYVVNDADPFSNQAGL